VPNAPRTPPQCPAGCGSTPCGGHPRLDSRPRPGCAAAVDAACGACVHCRGRRGVHGRSAAGDRHVPALLRRPAAVSAADIGRPASTWPQSRTSSGHCRGVRCRGRPWVPGQVGAAGGHRRSKCATADAACGHRQPAGGRHGGHPRLRQGHADTAAWARGHRGSGRLDSRQRNRPLPLGCPAGNGTARSVDWCSTSDWSAPVGSGLLTLDASSIQTDPDGSRRIVWMINRMIKQGRQLDEPSRAGAQDLASAALSTRNGGESRSHLQRWTATLSA
jgi:hypothetical protein